MTPGQSTDEASRPDPSQSHVGQGAAVLPGPPGDRAWLKGLGALAALYIFIASINLMGHGLKTIAREPAGQQFTHRMFDYAGHPLAGLCVGILLTSLIQSSSFTTSFTVGLVAAGQINLATAIPIIMGANIGTSVTNLLVSLGQVRHRLNFRRSVGGAVVHDFFNVLNVAVLLPLEVVFGIVSRPAEALAKWIGQTAFFATDPKTFNVVKLAIEPVTKAADWVSMDFLALSATTAGGAQTILGVIALFVALVFLVKMLQGLVKDRLSGLFRRTLFRSPWVAFLMGVFITTAVQSSSVTTSLLVPLVGAGILKLRQVYPYTLGANIGTTVTAMLAALFAAAIAAGKGSAAEAAAAGGLAVAMAHLLFNVYGTCIFWPLQSIPISLANGFARLAAKRRLLAGVYILTIFFVLPVLVIFLVRKL